MIARAAGRSARARLARATRGSSNLRPCPSARDGATQCGAVRRGPPGPHPIPRRSWALRRAPIGRKRVGRRLPGDGRRGRQRVQGPRRRRQSPNATNALPARRPTRERRQRSNARRPSQDRSARRRRVQRQGGGYLVGIPQREACSSRGNGREPEEITHEGETCNLLRREPETDADGRRRGGVVSPKKERRRRRIRGGPARRIRPSANRQGLVVHCRFLV